VSEVIGRNLRRYREEQGWSQDHTALLLRNAGLPWTRTMLAKVERGGRGVEVEELFLLSIAFVKPLTFFLNGGPDEWVTLSAKTSARPRAVQAMLSAKTLPGSGGHISGGAYQDKNFRLTLWEQLDPAWPELSGPELSLADVESTGEVERKAADRLGVNPLMVARAARVAWKTNLADERDARVKRLVPKGSSPRTVQAERGHVTRQLLEELRPVIAGRAKRKGRKKR